VKKEERRHSGKGTKKKDVVHKVIAFSRKNGRNDVFHRGKLLRESGQEKRG